MSANTGNAPAWLFSFLDLAFLLLIAVLLTSDREVDPTVELASIELPEIQQSSTTPLSLDTDLQWQVLVHPPREPGDVDAFSLVAGVTENTSAQDDEIDRFASADLQRELRTLSGHKIAKPLLAPHRDSRSEDFLTALGFVQEVWPEAHSAAVTPLGLVPSVSAGPSSEGSVSPALSQVVSP